MRLWLVTALATLCLGPVGDCPVGAQPRSGPPGPGAAPLGGADRPVWNVGDEWTYRWESQRGKGTFTLIVERDEVVEGVADYVIASGARRTYWQKSDLGFHLTALD